MSEEQPNSPINPCQDTAPENTTEMRQERETPLSVVCEGPVLEEPFKERLRRVPGPAEAGLLFSVTAFLQLYAVGWLSSVSPSATVQVILAETVFIALPPLLLALVFRYHLADTFRLRLPKFREVGFLLLLSPIATLAAYSAGVLAIVLVRMVFGTLQLAGDMGDILSRGLPGAVVTIGIVPAVCEEWMFRGFFQRGMEGLGARRAVLLSGFLFGLFHFDFQRFAAQALLGLVIAYVVYRSGSILNGMLLHFLHNAGSVLITGLAGGIGMAGAMGTAGGGVVSGVLVGSAGLETAGGLRSVFASLATVMSGSASGDIFSMPVIVDYANQLGISMEDLIRTMAAGSAFVLLCSLVVLAGLLVAFRHITRNVAHPQRPLAPKRAFLTTVPGLALILAVYAAIALSLAGHPAAETLMRVLFLPVVS